MRTMKELKTTRSGTFQTVIKYNEKGECESEVLTDVHEVDEIHEIEVDGEEFQNWDKAEAYARTGLTELERKLLDTIEDQKGTLYAVMEEAFIRDAHSGSGIPEIKERLDIESDEEAISRIQEVAEEVGENLEAHIKHNPEYADQTHNLNKSRYVAGE